MAADGKLKWIDPDALARCHGQATRAMTQIDGRLHTEMRMPAGIIDAPAR